MTKSLKKMLQCFVCAAAAAIRHAGPQLTGSQQGTDDHASNLAAELV